MPRIVSKTPRSTAFRCAVISCELGSCDWSNFSSLVMYCPLSMTPGRTSQRRDRFGGFSGFRRP